MLRVCTEFPSQASDRIEGERKSKKKKKRKKEKREKREVKAMRKNTKVNLVVQLGGDEYNAKTVSDAVKAKVKESGILMKDAESIDVYLKPEEGKAYYVVHGTSGDDIDNGSLDLAKM